MLISVIRVLQNLLMSTFKKIPIKNIIIDSITSKENN
jgi:hypothetical protein